jgi:general stress protein 26
MPTPAKLEKKFWEAVKSDRTMMLGLVDAEEAHTRPMTALLDGEVGPIWFFTARDTSIVEALAEGSRAIATFASKDHSLFAAVHGDLRIDNDRAVIDRLWNPFVAAWYEEGKDDPKLVLLRFDAGEAQIWENASSLMAGIKMLFGRDPKRDYQDKVAEVDLSDGVPG